MPVIGFFVRAMDALPVYRRQDEGADVTRNSETFIEARRLLARGGAIAICPEGVSHDEPRLKPIKSGTARIALGAASKGDQIELRIVPVGLYYTAKTTFRSGALLYFGRPITVPSVELGPDGEPPKTAVDALSDQIESALKDVMLHAEHAEAISMISRAEKIFSAELPETGGSPSLARELELKKLFLEGYTALQTRDPGKLAALDSRMRRFEEQLAQLKLEPSELERPRQILSTAVTLVASILLFALFTPLALLGTLLHYPAYRLAGYFARRLSKNADDVVSTIKIIAAMLLFPLTWIVTAVAAYLAGGWKLMVVGLVLAPLSGYLAVRFFEELDRFVGSLRGLLFFFTRRIFFLRLIAERRAIYDEILKIGKEIAELSESQPTAS
jgi:hypothetical protein